MKQRLPVVLVALIFACYFTALALVAFCDPTPGRQVSLACLCGVAFVLFGALGALVIPQMEDTK